MKILLTLGTCISILKQSPLTSFLITMTLILPFSVAMLAASYIFTHLLTLTPAPEHLLGAPFHQWLIFVLVELFCSLYLLFVTTLCLLSAAIMIKFITTSSINTSKPVSFSSTVSTTISEINPSDFFDGFIVSFDFALMTCLCPIALVAIFTDHNLSLRLFYTLAILFIALLEIKCIRILTRLSRHTLANIFTSACNIIPSCRTILTRHTLANIFTSSCNIIPNCPTIIHKCTESSSTHPIITFIVMILNFALIILYLSIYEMINGIFAVIVALYPSNYSIYVRISVGVLLLGVLVIMNWITLFFNGVKTYDIVDRVNNDQGINKTNNVSESAPRVHPMKIDNIDEMKTNDVQVSIKASQMMMDRV